MWLPAITEADPAEEPVSLASMKEYLEEDRTTRDGQIADLIGAARAHVEDYTGTRLITQTVRLRASLWRDLEQLPIGPVQTVTSISYLDPSGAELEVVLEDVRLVAAGLEAGIFPAVGASWPVALEQPGAISIVAVVGFETVPPTLIAAIKQLVAQWYDNRAAASERPLTAAAHSVDALLANHRIHALG